MVPPVSMDGLAVDFAMGFAMKLRVLKVLLRDVTVEDAESLHTTDHRYRNR